VLRNRFTDRWHGHEQELAADRPAHQALAAAIGADDHQLAPINAGQGVAMLRAVRPAADLIDEMCADAARLLGRRFTP
jgi:nitronate monooxygenase